MDIRMVMRDYEGLLTDSTRRLFEQLSTAHPKVPLYESIENAYLDGVISYGTSVELKGIYQDFMYSLEPMVKNLTGSNVFELRKLRTKRVPYIKHVRLSGEMATRNMESSITISNDVWYVWLIVSVDIIE